MHRRGGPPKYRICRDRLSQPIGLKEAAMALGMSYAKLYQLLGSGRYEKLGEYSYLVPELPETGEVVDPQQHLVVSSDVQELEAWRGVASSPAEVFRLREMLRKYVALGTVEEIRHLQVNPPRTSRARAATEKFFVENIRWKIDTAKRCLSNLEETLDAWNTWRAEQEDQG